MSSPLPEAEVRRVYIDALERAVRHAEVHVPRDEALEIGHHVATAVARPCEAQAGERANPPPSAAIHELGAFLQRAVPHRLREVWRARRRRTAAVRAYEKERTAVGAAWAQPGAQLESREL